MSKLFWAYENAHVKDRAYSPQPLSLEYGQRKKKRSTDLQREVAKGRRILPSDCGPIGLISRYGFSIQCPGIVTLKRSEHYSKERYFESDYSSFGHAIIGGDKWPNSDSDRIASWISGSEYIKIQTGIIILFPQNMYLYQGPLPNISLLNISFDTMAGIEYGNPNRACEINGKKHYFANLNIIIKLPPLGSTVTIDRGEKIAWFFLMPKLSSLSLERAMPEHISFSGG